MDQAEHFTSSRDQFEAENAFLRLKLEMEHNLKEYSNNEVPPEIENVFLRSIYDFEQKYADATRITLFEKMEKPKFRKYSDLHPDELAAELQRLHDLMRASQIVLDTICEYDDGVIYKFFTGDLLETSVDSNVCKEMVIHFTYVCP